MRHVLVVDSQKCRFFDHQPASTKVNASLRVANKLLENQHIKPEVYEVKIVLSAAEFKLPKSANCVTAELSERSTLPIVALAFKAASTATFADGEAKLTPNLKLDYNIDNVDKATKGLPSITLVRFYGDDGIKKGKFQILERGRKGLEQHERPVAYTSALGLCIATFE